MIWLGMPPTAPAIVGFPFHSASVTVRPNPSLKGLLNHQRGRLLQGVDFDCTPRGKIEDDYVGVTACGFFDLLQDCSTFGIVRSSAARQYKLAVNVFLSQLVGSYQAHRIFEAVKPRHLGHDRPGAVDSELVTHLPLNAGEPQ